MDGKPATSPVPTPLLPVKVTIGGLQAVVQYAGGAYDEVAGVLQRNVVVPATLSGSAVPVVVQVGNAVSQAGVTIAVAQ